MKINCWEFKKCGREPNGVNAAAQGVCPAATEQRLDQVHGGHNAGRACWMVTDTNCDRLAQSVRSPFDRLASCASCAFFQQVVDEQGSALCSTNELTMRLREAAPANSDQPLPHAISA